MIGNRTICINQPNEAQHRTNMLAVGLFGVSQCICINALLFLFSVLNSFAILSIPQFASLKGHVVTLDLSWFSSVLRVIINPNICEIIIYS